MRLPKEFLKLILKCDIVYLLLDICENGCTNFDDASCKQFIILQGRYLDTD